MKQVEEELLFTEEMELALINLATLTRQGTVRWNCTHCNPLALMPTQDDRYAYISLILQAEAKHNGHTFSLELTDSIDIPSGRGNLSVIFAPDWVATEAYSTSLSDFSKYENCPTWELLNCFQNKPLVLIADAVFPQLETSQVVIDAKPKGDFRLDLYPPHIANSPITMLSKMLHEAGRLTDFHRCVLDMDYRSKLIKENGF